MILDDKTRHKYGYVSSELSDSSHKKIIYLCPGCKNEKETQKRYYRDGHICSSCSGKQSSQKYSHLGAGKGKHALVAYWATCKEKGVHPNGKKLFTENEREQIAHEWKKQYNREYMRKNRETLLGKVTNRLRASMRHYLRGKKGFTLLPYTPVELQAHIQAKLDECNCQCPMCGVSLMEKFDIDHRVPLSTAKTVDELILLFALSNLDVLCPSCNQHVKGTKLISYLVAH